MKKLACAAALAAAILAIPSAAKAQSSVTCESYGGRRQTCRVDTRGEVRLSQQLSDTRCIRGRSWGTVPGGVWVDDGCRARFTVYNSGRYDDRYGRDGRYDDRNARDRDGRYDDRHGRGRDHDGWGRNGRDGWGRGTDRVIGGSWAVDRCRAAVRRQIGSRRIDFTVRDNDRNRVRLDWRSDNRYSGTCRVERDGDVRVSVNRRR